jgi:hypothetical protein
MTDSHRLNILGGSSGSGLLRKAPICLAHAASKKPAIRETIAIPTTIKRSALGILTLASSRLSKNPNPIKPKASLYRLLLPRTKSASTP